MQVTALTGDNLTVDVAAEIGRRARTIRRSGVFHVLYQHFEPVGDRA